MAHLVAVGVICVLVVSLFTRQIIDALGSGRVQLRGGKIRTRQDNPASYRLSIGVQVAVILVACYMFLLTILKASK